MFLKYWSVGVFDEIFIYITMNLTKNTKTL